MLDLLIETTKMTPIEIMLKMNKDGFVSGKNLYEFLELDKSNYSKWCKVNIKENAFAEKGKDYISFVLKDERNPHPTSEYLLTPSFAKKLTMASKTPRGEQARSYFVACEETLRRVAEEKQQWAIERSKGVMIRHILTDTIKMKIADSPNKKFAYPNYTKLVYKTIFGKPLKELEKEYGVKPRESIRDYLNAEQLKEVESVEMLVSSLINLGMGYDEIKNFLAERYHPDMLLAG